MKISFVATVRNEDDTIDEFIRSILHQSKKPDEIIIVDGGSADTTTAKLKAHKKVTLLVKKGNRSIGRNFGIAQAKGDIILVSDAGCRLDKDWIKNITAPLHDSTVDVVSGYYKPVTYSIFEKSLATYTCVMPDRVDPQHFLPSSRSVAFRITAWKKVGGYPEYLDTCEDLVFAKNMKQAGMRFVFAKNAIGAFRQFYSYAKGDGMARYFRPQTPLLYIRYLLVLSLIVFAYNDDPKRTIGIIIGLLAVYIAWAIKKNYKYVKDPRALLYLPLLQCTSDIAVLFGTTTGFLSSLFLRR